LACQVLRQNPSIFTMSLLVLLAFVVFSIVWVLLFGRLFLLGQSVSSSMEWIPESGSGWIMFFYVLMYIWTSMVFHNIEKTTIAGVVGEWYFASTHQHTTWDNFRSSITTSFGAISFSSLVSSFIQTVQYCVTTLRKASGSYGLIVAIATT
jgi:hypothetical protein